MLNSYQASFFLWYKIPSLCLCNIFFLNSKKVLKKLKLTTCFIKKFLGRLWRANMQSIFFLDVSRTIRVIFKKNLVLGIFWWELTSCGDMLKRNTILVLFSPFSLKTKLSKFTFHFLVLHDPLSMTVGGGHIVLFIVKSSLTFLHLHKLIDFRLCNDHIIIFMISWYRKGMATLTALYLPCMHLNRNDTGNSDCENLLSIFTMILTATYISLRNLWHFFPAHRFSLSMLLILIMECVS